MDTPTHEERTALPPPSKEGGFRAEETVITSADQDLLQRLQNEIEPDLDALAVDLGMPLPHLQQRLRFFEDQGWLRGFCGQLFGRALGFDVTAFVLLTCQHSTLWDEISARTLTEEEIQECHTLGGEWTHLLKIQTPSTASLDALVHRIQEWPAVIRTQNLVVMATAKQSTVLPLALLKIAVPTESAQPNAEPAAQKAVPSQIALPAAQKAVPSQTAAACCTKVRPIANSAARRAKGRPIANSAARRAKGRPIANSTACRAKGRPIANSAARCTKGRPIANSAARRTKGRPIANSTACRTSSLATTIARSVGCFSSQTTRCFDGHQQSDLVLSCNDRACGGARDRCEGGFFAFASTIGRASRYKCFVKRHPCASATFCVFSGFASDVVFPTVVFACRGDASADGKCYPCARSAFFDQCSRRCVASIHRD